HVDSVVEHDDAAVADQAIARGEGFEIERRVEERAGEVRTERAAALHGAHGSAAGGAAADVVDEVAEREAERGLEQTAMLDVAGKLDRHRAARLAKADAGISLGAV